MHLVRPFFCLLLLAMATAADPLSVDASGVTFNSPTIVNNVLTVNGAAPAAPPAATAVTIGGGTLQAGGAVIAPNVLSGRNPLTFTAATTLSTAAIGRLVRISGAIGFTVTLPSASSAGAGSVIGISIDGFTSARAQYVIAAASGQTLDGRVGLTLVHTNTLLLISDGAANWIALAKKVDTEWLNAGPIVFTSTRALAAPTVPAGFPAKGANPTADVLRWRRIGDSMEVTWEYYQTSVGTNGAGDYLFQLPLNASFDKTKVQVSTNANPSADGATPLGYGEYSGLSGVHYPGVIIPFAWDGSYVRFFINCDTTSTPTMGFPGSSFIAMASANHGYVVRASVPIIGW